MLLQHGQIPDCPIDILGVVGDVPLACSTLLVTQAVHVKAAGRHGIGGRHVETHTSVHVEQRDTHTTDSMLCSGTTMLQGFLYNHSTGRLGSHEQEVVAGNWPMWEANTTQTSERMVLPSWRFLGADDSNMEPNVKPQG